MAAMLDMPVGVSGADWLIFRVNLWPEGIPVEPGDSATLTAVAILGPSNYSQDTSFFETHDQPFPQVLPPGGNIDAQILMDSAGSSLALIRCAVIFEDPVVTTSPSCDGDLTGDTMVGVADLTEVLDQWGDCPEGKCTADLDHNGIIDTNDILRVIREWGPCETGGARSAAASAAVSGTLAGSRR